MKDMTLQEKVKLLNEIRSEYYERIYEDKNENQEFDDLIKRVDDLRLNEIDFIYDNEHNRGKLFICPDPEWEFPDVYEIADEYMSRAINVIYDATCLYYNDNDDFWDTVTTLDQDELIKIYTQLNNIPIIRFFPASNVELLNVRKLNQDIH